MGNAVKFSKRGVLILEIKSNINLPAILPAFLLHIYKNTHIDWRNILCQHCISSINGGQNEGFV